MFQTKMRPYPQSAQSIIVWTIATVILLNNRYIKTTNAIKTKLTWVNGIGHNVEHMEAGKEKLTTMFGGKRVEFCHNPTAMSHEEDTLGFIGDLTQATTQKLGRITMEVDKLVEHLKQALELVGKSGRVIHIAHSQGALITALAARQLEASELAQIEVLTFGGAAALLRSEFPFYRIVNYYAVNDPLLHVVPAAVKALRSGFLSSYQQSDPEFVFLSPRLGDPVHDHMLFGPTYGPALAWEGQRYQRTYQNMVSRTYRNMALTAISFYGHSKEIMQYFYNACILRLCDYCMYFYLWQKDKLLQTKILLMNKVVKPILVIIHALWLEIQEIMRKIKEGRDKYEPLESLPKGSTV